MFFLKYDNKTRKRIFSLLSRVIDTNIKLGIEDPRLITDNFLREIRNKKLETWSSLEKYADSKYFYHECTRYITNKIQAYKDRYGKISDRGRVTESQVDYLNNLIERSLKHSEYSVRKAGIEELNNILKMLSKNNAAFYIDRYKEILGYNNTKKVEREGD